MSISSGNIFNPNKLPVEKLTIAIQDDRKRNVSALDPYWVENRQLVPYEPPPTNDKVSGAMDMWCDKMKIYIVDLKWLLSMDHHKFWSTVIYHKQCMDMIVSFLQEAKPPYLQSEIYERNCVRNICADIRKYMFMVVIRLMLDKESETEWMSKEYLRDIIYNKYIFTVPLLWDFSSLYGFDNSKYVGKLINDVFTLQPKYTADLEVAITFVQEVFKYIILTVNHNYDNLEPPNLPDTFKIGDIPKPSNDPNDQIKVTFPVLENLVLHLLDTVFTLRSFVEVYPKCIEVLRRKNFVISIAQLYEYAMPYLYEKLEELDIDSNSERYKQLVEYTDMTREEIIDIFREILALYKNSILVGEGNIESQVEQYLSVMMEGLSEKLLIRDYHICYPVNEDLEIIKLAYPDLDSVKTDFILQAIYSSLDDELTLGNSRNGPQTSEQALNCHIDTTDNIQSSKPIKENEIPDNIRQESLISEVRDILPHLGDGFILKCLEHYNFSSERVISSVLENTLAEPLARLDQSLPIIPEDPLDKKFLETGIQRLNVFDGDEFDIMTRDDVDVSRIHTGKRKSKYKNLSHMLDDKSDVKKNMDFYAKYNLVCEDGMYSDEYDDTYDDEADVVTGGDSTADDLGRPFVTPRTLQKHQPRDQQQESSSEGEAGEEKAQSRAKMDFCTNPEEIRARREANMRARQQKGGRPPPRNADVVGKPKGQGQEKETLKGRDNKEKHKSSRSNHNRRQGSQWKRSQGMVPS